MNKKTLKADLNTKLTEEQYQENIIYFLKKIKIKAIIGLIISLGVFLLTSFLSDEISRLIVFRVPIFIFILILYLILSILLILISFGYPKYSKKVLLQKTLDEKYRIKYYIFIIIDLFCFIFSTIAIIYFFMMFILTPTTIDGVSMEKQYSHGDKILIWHLNYKPQNNDVIIIDVTKERYHISEDKFFIKRIVAKGGDKVEYKNGFLVVNNVNIELMSQNQYNTIIQFLGSIKVKNNLLEEGYYIALGDNRNDSVDSRSIGLIAEEDIIGRAIFRIMPFNRFGLTK